MRLGSGTFSRRLALVCTLAIAPLGAADPAGEADPGPSARFADARVGLFINWGVFTLLGRDPAVMERDKLPLSEYEKLLPQFNPTGFSADAWVKAAESAGARYLAVTARGPDGFCLFDSKHTAFDVVDATPFGKDPLKALAEACKARRMPLVVQFSLRDAPQTDRARRAVESEGEVRELCTNYGPLAGVWFTGPDDGEDLPALAGLVRKLQPGALVGTRGPSKLADVRMIGPPGGVAAPAGAGPAGDSGPVFEMTIPVRSPGPGTGSDARTRDRETLVSLVPSVARAAGVGMNLRLEVVARSDGSLAPDLSARLAGLGRWLETHGESIYGTHKGPIAPQPWGVSTLKEPKGGAALIYLHVFHPEGPVILPNAVVSLSARLLGGSKPLPITRADGHALIDLPEDGRDPADTVVVLAPGVLDPQTPVRRQR